jgi:hypothetical protein
MFNPLALRGKTAAERRALYWEAACRHTETQLAGELQAISTQAAQLLHQATANTPAGRAAAAAQAAHVAAFVRFTNALIRQIR